MTTFNEWKSFVVAHPLLTGLLLAAVGFCFLMLVIWLGNDADDRREERDRKIRHAKYQAQVAQRANRLNVVAGKATGRTTRIVPLNRKANGRRNDVA